MKLRQLRLFTAVVDCGGVIKAAERLHISQPAISSGLKSLEEELGVALFDRANANRRLNLTAAGSRFYQHASAILKQCEAARTDVVGIAGKRHLVRIGAMDTLPQEYLTELITRLDVRRPDWEVVLWEGSVQQLTQWLGDGRIAVAWCTVHDQTEGETVLWSEPLVAVISPMHPLAEVLGRAIDVHELAAEPFLFRSRCELDALGRAQLRAAGVSLRVLVRAERDELVFRLVREGKGVTLAPRSLVPPDLVALEVSGLAVNRSIGLQWQPDTDPNIVATVAEEISDVAGVSVAA